jgi:hypothetical protein
MTICRSIFSFRSGIWKQKILLTPVLLPDFRTLFYSVQRPHLQGDMRTLTPPGPVLLLGTGEATVAALWRLSAAGAQIRWYADRADIGEEIALANALGSGRLELSFDNPPPASPDRAAVARGDVDSITEREISAAGHVRDVLVRFCSRIRALRNLSSAEPEAV